MQDLGYELPRIPIPRTRVNKGKKRARGYYAPKANKCTQNAALRKRKPRRSGAFLGNTNLPSCTDEPGCSCAVVGAEAVASARFVEEDVRFVAAKVVGDDLVVRGLRCPAKERIHTYHNPARDGGGAGGDVAREMVAPDLHTARAEKPDPYPRGWALPGVVRNLVCYHLVVADGVRQVSGEDQARTVVVNLISDEGTSVRVADEDAEI